MPVSFMLIGIMLIYSLFYVSNKILKIALIIICAALISGYFVPVVQTGHFSVNIVFIATIATLSVLLLLINAKRNLRVISCALIAVLTYLMLVKLNADYLSILRPMPVALVLLVCSLPLTYNIFNLVSYYCFSYCLINVANIVLEKPLGGVVLGDVELLNLIIIAVFVSCLLSVFVNKIKIAQKRKI